MKRIILVRHAESQANVDLHHYETIPDYDFTLTETGETQALDAGKAIAEMVGGESLVAYVSPYRRTRMTFAGISESLDDQVLNIDEDARIREQDFGHFQNKVAFMQAFRDSIQYGRFYYRFANGESVADVYARVSGFLESLYRDAQNPKFPDNVLIVTHGITLRVLAMCLQRETEDYFHSLQNPHNGEIIVFERKRTDFGQDIFVPIKPMSTRDAPLTEI